MSTRALSRAFRTACRACCAVPVPKPNLSGRTALGLDLQLTRVMHGRDPHGSLVAHNRRRRSVPTGRQRGNGRSRPYEPTGALRAAGRSCRPPAPVRIGPDGNPSNGDRRRRPRASDRLVLSLSQPLAPPRRAFTKVWQGWNDYREARLVAGVDRQFEEYRSKVPPLSLFLFRWRPVGSNIWSYRSHDEPTSDVFFTQTLQRDALSTKYEVQVSRLRHQIEQETPEALRWTGTLTAISHGPPNDVTVRTSSDSVEVTWSANRADTRWMYGSKNRRGGLTDGASARRRRCGGRARTPWSSSI